jgi:glycosyltransferase involved in cell wall biosynthesis
MKICVITQFYTPYFPKGGTNRYCCEVVPRLRGKGIDVRIVRRDEGSRFFGTFLWIVDESWSLPEVDDIHALNFRAALIPYLAGKEFVLHTHDLGPQDLYRVRGWLQRKMIRNAKQIITPTNAVKQRIINEIGVDEEKITVIYNGIDAEKFRPLKDRGEGIGYVGREAGYKAGLVPKIEEKLSVKIDYPHERLSDEELVKFYQGHELIVVPSLAGEGFSFVTMEALACGCKVVAADLPAIKEVAKDYALYAKAGDAEDFLEKIKLALKNPHAGSFKAYRYIRDNFSWDKHLDKLIEVYKR